MSVWVENLAVECPRKSSGKAHEHGFLEHYYTRHGLTCVMWEAQEGFVKYWTANGGCDPTHAQCQYWAAERRGRISNALSTILPMNPLDSDIGCALLYVLSLACLCTSFVLLFLVK